MRGRTLQRYFAWRFVGAVMAVFASVFILVAMIDYVELMRRTADLPNVSAWTVAETSFLRVPQITERVMPFSVLIGAMICYLSLSRRLELVVARSQLVTARRNAYVAGFSLLAAMGKAEARDLGLGDDGPLYDPQVNYDRVKNKWWDWERDPDPVAQSTRTVDIPAPTAEIPVNHDSDVTTGVH